MAGARPTEANPYGFGTRPDMLPYVPLSGALLDVGCASGGFAHSLRAAGFEGELWGLEPEAEAAEEALGLFDRVIHGSFPTDCPPRQFDTIVFNDVLEHLVDPWGALASARSFLTADGVVVASIPNIRYWPVLKELVLRGRWTYTETGTLDRTHLRFFTRETVAHLFESSGFRVETLAPTNVLSTRRWRARYVNRLPIDFRALQYAVVARPA